MPVRASFGGGEASPGELHRGGMDATWLDAVFVLTTGPSYCAAVRTGPEEVATAYHCVAKGGRPQLVDRAGRVAYGTVAAVDVVADLALLRVPGLDSAVPVVALAPGSPEPGSEAWAIGHPYGHAAEGQLAGTLRYSVSRGVVAAVGDTFVQSDAAVNPGNSGGPLLDGEGRLLGIVSRRLNGDNLGFASRAGLLEGLRAQAPAPIPLGGSVGVNVGAYPNLGGYALAVELEGVARDRAWARVALGGALGDAPSPYGWVGVGLRQRVGRGPLATAIDVGAGANLSPLADLEPPAAEVVGRVTLVGVGVGVHWAPADARWGVSLDLAVNALHGVW